MNDKPLVIYHADCADGFCAAWLARCAMPNAELVPAHHGQPPPDVRGREVYILDFSYKRPVMIDIMSRARSTVVLDHHETAKSELDGLIPEKSSSATGPIIHFDMTKSGGRLAWDYFSAPDAQKSGAGRPPFNQPRPPWLVNYTEDYDLWRWALPKSREVSAALASYPLDFKLWDAWGAEPTPPPTFVVEGEAILRYQQAIVDRAVKKAVEIELDGHKVLCTNATTLISEIGGALAEGRPFGCTYFIRGDGQKIWSLRSREGGINVADIAKHHGGGGHRNAAGFQEML